MSRDPINSKHKPLLWDKAAGCCELCSKPLYEEGLQRQEGNYSNIAHINAASPGGPRFDADQTPEERSSIDNLMLLCQECHKLIDTNPDDFPAKMLRTKKNRARASRCISYGGTPKRKMYHGEISRPLWRV